MKVKPVPASPDTIAQYAAFLARTHRPASVRQYMNIIRILHVNSGYDNPLEDNWILKSTLKGIDRCLGLSVNRKKPVDPYLLLEIHKRIKMDNVLHVMFFAAALTMFFGMLRRSNLMPTSSKEFTAEKQFIRKDFTTTAHGLQLKVKWSKTIQCQERSYVINIPKLVNHALCPYKAIITAFQLVPLPLSAPAFVMDIYGTPMSASTFVKLFKDFVELCGHDSARYSSHSFRRGSACWALQSGIPGEIVQQMGDWKSGTYKDYLDEVSESHKMEYVNQFAAHLPK